VALIALTYLAESITYPRAISVRVWMVLFSIIE
jgi:hypothetical protein